jgi:hypothetical protein
MMRHHEEDLRRSEERYNREQREESQRQAQESQRRADDRRRDEIERKQHNVIGPPNPRTEQHSDQTYNNDNGKKTYIIRVDPDPPRPIGSILISIICAGVLGGILGLNFGLLGVIGGAFGGWFIGKIIGKKIFITLVILGILGGGLYMAMPNIPSLQSMFSSITAKVIPSSGKGTTVINDVNFRAEPSMDSAIIKTLRKGETISATGNVSGGWTQIKHNSDTGWVSSEYIKRQGISIKNPFRR